MCLDVSAKIVAGLPLKDVYRKGYLECGTKTTDIKGKVTIEKVFEWFHHIGRLTVPVEVMSLEDVLEGTELQIELSDDWDTIEGLLAYTIVEAESPHRHKHLLKDFKVKDISNGLEKAKVAFQRMGIPIDNINLYVIADSSY